MNPVLLQELVERIGLQTERFVAELI